MSTVREKLEPASLWEYFRQILEIPRCSGNEKAIGDFIVSIAKKYNLSWDRDKVGNIVVRKGGTPGYQGSDAVILQGHIDMVGEKNSDVGHDFSKDTIKAEIKEGWMQAKGTTLGADNGIGVAAALAVMEETTLEHGPLEFLFTVDEETGLTGARKIGPGFLKGNKLLNLDSEGEGIFTIGCAGGADSEIILPLKRTKSKGGKAYRLKISGFRGGHSGIDINQGRGNAIKILARLLWQLSHKYSFQLVSVEGGNKRNAIPREAWAELILTPSVQDSISFSLKEVFGKVQAEYKAVEKEAQFTLENNEGGKDALAPEAQKKLINFLFTLPHGVLAMHPEMKELVETSNNVAIIRTHEDKAEVICSSRSSVASALEATRNMIRAVCELAGAEVNQPEGYPGWMPNLQSSLLKTLKQVYKKTFQKEAKVEAVHAGLECGIIGEKFPDMDMISFGPTIEHPHSPEERVNIESVAKFWKFLTAILKELR